MTYDLVDVRPLIFIYLRKIVTSSPTRISKFTYQVYKKASALAFWGWGQVLQNLYRVSALGPHNTLGETLATPLRKS